jgi:sugar lactone lactonase YvrE
MSNAFGVAIDPTTGKLFVADRNNSRVLRFSSANKLISGSAAEAVLGQPDFVTNTANTGGLSASTMNLPIRVYVDAGGRLWVSDYNNHRILRFDNASTKHTGDPADGVLGQPDFVTNSAGTSAAKMNRTTGVFVDGSGTLWVGERDNNRVLRFDNAAAKANGANADGVLGEPDFVTSTGGLSATAMGAPFGVYVDAAGRLWVCEDNNNRALRFDNAAAKANGAAADGVLGQPDFTTNSAPNPTQNGTTNIRGVYGDGLGRIYLVEEGNHRILVFANAASLPNGANATNVLGQADFVSKASPTPPTANSLMYPNSMFIDNVNNQIWVADAGNNRVLRFDVKTGGSTTDVKDVSGQRPTDYELSQNYPNPFNPSTTINFSLPKAGFVTIEIHNILGQVVATLVQGTLNAGEHTVRFNAGSLASGVYLYTLRVGDRYEVRKMMLMK